MPVVHDWGGLIGLRWACEHPDAGEALVISSSGFFPDGKWHGMAKALRTPEVGEQRVAGLDRDGLRRHAAAPEPGFDDDAIDEYWKGLGDEAHRRGQLELYRSGDFEKLARYRLADLACRCCWCGARATSSRRWPAPTASSASCPTPSWW